MAQRVGMFGGAFDPPHDAHVALARAAVAQLGLDVLHVLPTGQAWHKTRQLSAAEHRLAMTRLAFAGCDRVLVDDRELRRAGPTYTVDTLTELQAQYPGTQLHLVIGEDQARALTSWHRWDEIVRKAIISVASREDSGANRTVGDLSSAPLVGAHIVSLQVPAMPHSATTIRARVAAGQGISHLVAPAVARYIEQHHLYLPA